MTSARFSLAGSLRARLQDPLRRGADALIIGTGITSVLGLVFWALAARSLPTTTVGIGAALISTVTLLATFSTLGMENGLLRFLPAAGAATGRLILTCYAFCAGAAMLAAGIFLMGQPMWAEKMDFLRESPLSMIIFAVGTAAWVVYVLQDQVLVGLRHPGWVPLTNGASSLLKILALPLLASAAAWAIFAATIIPAVLAVIVVGALVLRFARNIAAADPRSATEAKISMSALMRFAGPDHVANLMWLATIDVLTLIVLQVDGAEASAHWYIASTIGYTLYLITSNVGSALIAESAHDPEHHVAHARRALRHCTQLVVPAAVIGVVAAPLALRLFGTDYAENATAMLQLILISAIPQLIVGISVSTARVRGDMKTVLGVYAFTGLATWGGSWIGLELWGLTGIGIAILFSQSLVAAYLLLSERTGLWERPQGWRGMLKSVRGTPLARRTRRNQKLAQLLVEPALAACGLPADRTSALLTSDSDTLVVAVKGDDQLLILKIATSTLASRGLKQHADTVRRLLVGLESDAGALLPRITRRAQVHGNEVVLESALPGATDTATLCSNTVSAAAYAAIGRVHEATGASRVVDEDLLDLWIDQPVDVIRRSYRRPSTARNLERIARELRRGLGGRQMQTALVHGNYWGGNVLTTITPEGPRISGIIDWENATPWGIPDTDLVHWWLTNQPGELGAIVVEALANPEAVRSGLSGLGATLTNADVKTEHIILLTWLWHVSAGLTRASPNRMGLMWVARNVSPVVHLFDGKESHSPKGTPQ
jgi:O-antigen/teichoic acid export membrane protein